MGDRFTAVTEASSAYSAEFKKRIAESRSSRAHAPEMVARLEVLRDNLVDLELLVKQYGDQAIQDHVGKIRAALDPTLVYAESSLPIDYPAD